MKCHLCGEENCRKTIRTFAESRCKDKAIEIGNSRLGNGIWRKE
jgi:hypothetical protein